MIQKHVIGRLGNQMFQYATVRAFQIKNRPNDEILLDFSEVYEKDSSGYKEELSYFNISNVKYGKAKVSFSQRFAIFCMNIVKSIVLVITGLNYNVRYNQMLYSFECSIQRLINRFGLYSFRLGYYEFKNTSKKNLVFYGTFESSKYFDDIKDVLIEEFTPKYGIIEKNKKLYEMIEKTNSVCVTIRRGDFVTDPGFKKNLYVCDENYFYKAIEYMKKNVKNARFFVFSDDVEWCKKNMNFPKDTVYESGDDPVWEKLRLMYSCKHFIISNSTFSWWAQYLSRNKDKVVVAPSRWGNLEYKGKGIKTDIFEDDWHLIDV